MVPVAIAAVGITSSPPKFRATQMSGTKMSASATT